MGGDLSQPPTSKSPTFLIAALKDPMGANLDRVQIVKGWMDAGGQLQEKVTDVVWSGSRKPGKNGKLPAVGNTVNLSDATYENTIGASELIAAWKDPSFDPALRAFYYVRVLEIPTPRWTLYDSVRYRVKMDSKVPMVEQQRAYTVTDLVHACEQKALRHAEWLPARVLGQATPGADTAPFSPARLRAVRRLRGPALRSRLLDTREILVSSGQLEHLTEKLRANPSASADFR